MKRKEKKQRKCFKMIQTAVAARVRDLNSLMERQVRVQLELDKVRKRVHVLRREVSECKRRIEGEVAVNKEDPLGFWNRNGPSYQVQFDMN